MDPVDRFQVYEVLDLMDQQGVAPNEMVYEILLTRRAVGMQIEDVLHVLTDMSARGITPTLKAASAYIKTAGLLGYPRLAIDLAHSFEQESNRRLPGEVWSDCLISAAENLFVSPSLDHLMIPADFSLSITG